MYAIRAIPASVAMYPKLRTVGTVVTRGAKDDQFRELFDTHAAVVHRYLARRLYRLGNSEVDDATEAVFVVAYRRLDEVLTVNAPRAWLLAVARKHAANLLRTADRRRSIIERFTTQPPLVDFAEQVVLDDAVASALASLSPADRELLELVAFDELTVAEVAACLRLAPATVSVRLHRARQRCKAAYESAMTPSASTSQTEGATT